MLVLVKRILRNMRLCCALLLVFCSQQTGVESGRFLQQPTLYEALPLSSTSIYLAWKGPINHPGGFMYRLFLKKESKNFEQQKDLSGSTWHTIVGGLEANVKYTICMSVVDKHYEAARGSQCGNVAVITTPAQLGHVSKTDRKYLTKGGYYRGARHYWPFDYETFLRDVKYSRDGKTRGAGVAITGKPRGYLCTNGSSWVRLGKFLKECVCDVHHCAQNGVSVGMWIKLSRFDNKTKVLLGCDSNVVSNTSGLVIFQAVRLTNGSRSQGRHISALVFMKHRKWKCSFAVKPGNWFYLTVTWTNHTGLRMFKNGAIMSEQKRAKSKPRSLRESNDKCAVKLSPPSSHGSLRACYDDLIIWNYELNRTLMYQVYRNAIDPPKIVDCKTSDGISAEVSIDDTDHIYGIKADYKISWKSEDGDGRGTNFTKDLSFRINGLAQSSEYIVDVQRRVFVTASSKKISEVVLSRPSQFTCTTRLNVPTRPKSFAVHETADEYLTLVWKPPGNTYGSVTGYKISYRVDDFRDRKWSHTFRADVKKTTLDKLKPFTDYVIKLSCMNFHGSGKAITLRATTAEGVPTPPRKLRVKIKGEIIVIKWREPREMKGLVDYRLFAMVNGNTRTICNACGESYKMEEVEQNTSYIFWVIAYNIKVPRFQSKPSRNETLTTPSFTPSSPRNFTATFTQSGIDVSWEKSSEPRGNIEYKLYGVMNGSKTVFCDECGLRHVMKDVARYAVYELWAVAYNVRRGYESRPSSNVTIDTASYVPTIPHGLFVNLSLDGMFISWSKSHVHHGSLRYQLEGLENNVKRMFCADCGLKYSINKTKPNMNYSFWVVVQNTENGYESVSSPILFHTARIRPSPPDHVLATEVKDSSAKVTWSPPKGVVEGEEIVDYKLTLYDALSILDVRTTDAPPILLNNLTQFSKYYVTVQVSSRAGYGPPSQQLTIHTQDKDECSGKNNICSEHANCINTAGSYFCSCLSGFVGDGEKCEALPATVTETDFCPGETARNITWKKTYHGYTDKNVCPNGTIGISTRECLKGNDSRSYWSDPNLSNCVSAWMAAIDDKLADPTLNSTVVGDFFLNLLDDNTKRGLYGGDVIKSVDVIDVLYNKSKNEELDQRKSNPTSAENLVKNLINITEKIVSPETIKIWNDIPKTRRAENSVKMMGGLENAVLKSAKIVNFSSIRNEHIDVRYGSVFNFKLRESASEENFVEIDHIKLPQPEEENEKEKKGQTVAVIKYNTIADVLSSEDQQLSDTNIVNTAVLSISMDPPLSTPFQKPLEFKLSNRKKGNFDRHKCAYFNTSRHSGFWSASGCEVFDVSDNYTTCHCYHMTSFSVLMQVKPVELSHSDKVILDWLTRIGLCVSVVALGLAFLTFVFLPRPCGHRYGSRCFRLCDQGYRPTYLKKVRTSIHANLILALALAEALFLWGIDKTENMKTCYTVAVALHYLFLVAFHWMAAEGVILYLVLVKVFQRKSANKDKKMFMVICWGTPAAIVCIALVIGHEYYLHEQCCWLSLTSGMIWSFVGPALAIILVNVFFLCCTFRVMGKRPRWDQNDKNMADKIRYWAKGAAIVTCLLGVTWVFGVFFLNGDSVIVAYMFNIFNAFQGLFIFVFHCLLDEKIRQQYYQVFCPVANVESRSPSHSTGNGNGKKEQRGGTFNSWLNWSVAHWKYQDSKSESCPTVAENTLKQLGSSTHSLSPCIDRRVTEIKRNSDVERPRGMSSIYHDSDENMDNIPDNILTVKHGSKNNSGRLDYYDEDTGGVFEDYWITTLSRENSREFLQVPQATCEDCLYEIKEWEEQREILRKTNSLHEQELKQLKEPCGSLESGHEYLDEGLNNETNMDEDSEPSEENETDSEDEHELLTPDSEQSGTSCTSIVPRIILSDFSKSKSVAENPKCYQMMKVTGASGPELSSASGNEIPRPTSV